MERECVLILLHMCPHTAICVPILLYVSSYHYTAAKELAADPTLRRYVRHEWFDRYATVTVKMTAKGAASADEYHHEFANWFLQPLREIR